jgi:RHS repeat-associated protein
METPGTLDPAHDVVRYYHTDAIGSVRVLTDKNGQVVERHDYEPFGEEWNPISTALKRGFTGQERDGETGLEYLGARYYASQFGRFTTADHPGFLDPFDPQSMNRYGYASNNPLRWVDPTGHNPECPTDYCESVTVTPPRPPDIDIGSFRFFWDSLFPPVAAQQTVETVRAEPNNAQRTLQCVASNASSGGVVAAGIFGAAAVGAGAPLLPYSWFGPAIGGGGRSGGTSALSAAARGFLGKGVFSGRAFVTEESGRGWNALSYLTGTASKAGIVGRLASRASVATGVAFEAYGAYKVYEAYRGCTARN